MSPLNRKLLRDLWRLRGQVLSVALVVASGVALLVMSLSAVSSLRATTDAYYDRYGFADAFAAVKRAPERLAARIRAIPGVQAVETRVGAFAIVDIPGMAAPATAQLLSLPDRGPPTLNRLAMKSGRLPAPGRDDEAVALARFAEAHGLGVGDEVVVLLNGARRNVRLVGLALSPEFVYAMGPGALIPDERSFGVLWMGRKALAAAYDLDGAFNSVALTFSHDARPAEAVDRLDRLLDRYGGAGAFLRADQTSNWFLMNELEQLKTMATVLPAIFLAAAAFLTNTVLARLIDIERRDISLMKAFGYRNVEIGLHYSLLAMAMTAVGVLIGWGVGLALGRYNTEVYATLFTFPFLTFRPAAGEFVISAGVSLAAALAGAIFAVRRAVSVKPADAMRPPLPVRYGDGVLPKRLTGHLDHPTRIVLRQLVRAPLRALITVVGVALAVGVLVMAMQWRGAIEHLATAFFEDAQHHNITVGFYEPRPMSARFDLARLPGVLAVEPTRAVSADLIAGVRKHRGGLSGVPAEPPLNAIHDARGWTYPTPAGGVVLSDVLATKLGLGVGDEVTAKVLAGARPTLKLPVVGLVETYIGAPAYVDLGILNRTLGDGRVFDSANLLVDPEATPALFAELKATPGVAAVTVKARALLKLHETLGETVLIFTSFFVVFSGALAIGVTYNATRVALSERGRELATLRVLGFRRSEISYILLAESALLTLLALPLGCLAGYGLVWLLVESFATELFRVPFAITPDAYAYAVLTTVAAAAIAAMLTRRRLQDLDMVAVLKTRE